MKIPKDLDLKNVMIDNSRCIIKVDGADSEKFLQNLLTNNITPEYSYSLLLTPQGKVLYDFFVYRTEDGFLLDCDQGSQVQILDAFSKYKLRQKVNFTYLANLGVLLSLGKQQGFFHDPRHQNLGYRAIVDLDALGKADEILELFDIGMDYNTKLSGELLDKQNQTSQQQNSLVSVYMNQLYNLALPCFRRDYGSQEYFPFELGLENFGAISYNKGCYVGQEVITRTKFRGTVRRRVYKLKPAGYFWPNQIYGIKHGDQIMVQEKIVGYVLGCYQKGLLAIVRDEAMDCDITIAGVSCEIV